MGKKLYEETQEGGICFKSERKPWEVRVPNYVYDLWMPVLGVVDIGVYNVYCRLERENVVKAISLGTIARACRIGKSRLYDTNKRLEKCGFIRIAPPEGWQRLAHYTTEITVLDPPQEVPAWAIKEYCQLKHGYQPLSPWLVQEDETQIEPAGVPNGTSGETGQDAVKEPEGTPKVVTLGLQPLGVELVDVEANFFIKNPNFPASLSPGGADSGKETDHDDESRKSSSRDEPTEIRILGERHSEAGDHQHASGTILREEAQHQGQARLSLPDGGRDHRVDNDGAAPSADPVTEAIIEQEQSNRTIWDDWSRTAAARAAAGGNWAAPAQAGGDDGLAAFGLFCLYDKRNKAPPREGTQQHRQQCDKVREALRAYGYQQAIPELVEKAAEIHCERKGSWVNVFYKSFVPDFGEALQDAEYFLKHGRLPNDEKGAKHGDAYQRDRGRIAQGAVQRRVATEEEARAILGDRCRPP